MYWLIFIVVVIVLWWYLKQSRENLYNGEFIDDSYYNSYNNQYGLELGQTPYQKQFPGLPFDPLRTNMDQNYRVTDPLLVSKLANVAIDPIVGF